MKDFLLAEGSESNNVVLGKTNFKSVERFIAIFFFPYGGWQGFFRQNTSLTYQEISD